MAARRRSMCITFPAALALLGCPSDDEPSGDGETGGGGITFPYDPLDGEGSDPPGNPDRDATWRSPSSLGNGMVHDTRYDLDAGKYKRTYTAQALAAGVDWTDFVASHDEKLLNGFRPTTVDADVALAVANGTIELAVTDRSVYSCDDDSNYRTKVVTHVFDTVDDEQSALAADRVSAIGEPRPTSIDTFTALGKVGTTVAWVYDNDRIPWRVVVGQDAQTFAQTLADLPAGYRPISLASRARDGESEYAAIFIDDGSAPEDWRRSLGLDWTDLDEALLDSWNDGFYPFRQTYEQGSESLPKVNVLWTKRSPELKLELRYDMIDLQIEGEDSQWRRRGYALEDAMAYIDGGETRYAGLWVRHEPYMRWQDGIEVDPNTAAYITRYLPFHDRVVQSMTLEGDPREGEFFRPAVTLHIFEGAQLALNRAYTYAPGIYPETRINASMATASVSKSITAAAVVREMAQRGLPLTSVFSTTAGFDHKDMRQVPTVADVLRNLGGFNGKPDSYEDHSLIDASAWGSYPISGREMYNYVVVDGHLNQNDKNSYWNRSTYDLLDDGDKTFRKFVYSNPGFSMLGELVRVQSGIDYEDYVRFMLLQPLGLEERIYPDPGHRAVINGPPRTGIRSYLINDAHPYYGIGCTQDAECDYLSCENCPVPTCSDENTCSGCSDDVPCKLGWTCVNSACVNTTMPETGSGAVPKPENNKDGSPEWRLNAGPVVNYAPRTAAWDRYAGTRFMGGAPLAAGGWEADGEALGILIRDIAQDFTTMSQATASQFWSPQFWNPNHNKGTGWNYGLGWYIRGNWIAWAGGGANAMSIVLHNRAYDFTVVYLSNLYGNGFGEFLEPLMTPVNQVWGQSVLGQLFPCLDDNTTQTNECTGAFGAY